MCGANTNAEGCDRRESKISEEETKEGNVPVRGKTYFDKKERLNEG